MAWTLGGITVRPGDEGDQRSVESSYAIQGVLDATADTVTWYGAKSQRRRLRFILFENDNGGTGLSTLETAVATDANVALVGDLGAQGNFRILSLNSARKQDHANTLPVWMCTAEMIKV